MVKKTHEFFKEPLYSSPEGIVAIGGTLTIPTLLEAYQKGIFPWPLGPQYPLTWFSPDPRGILFLKDFHVSRSLNKFLKKKKLSVSADQNFKEVIEYCSAVPRKNQDGTWITIDIKAAYSELHRLKIAHSVEIWHDQKLIGGLYGVEFMGVFCAESMFSLEPNASKIALFHLVELLQKKKIKWIDIQMLTPHMSRMGGTEIPRNQFLQLLKDAQKENIKIF